MTDRLKFKAVGAVKSNLFQPLQKLPEGSPHDHSFVSMFLVGVVNLSNGDDSWVLARPVAGLGLVIGQMPIKDPETLKMSNHLVDRGMLKVS